MLGKHERTPLNEDYALEKKLADFLRSAIHKNFLPGEAKNITYRFVTQYELMYDNSKLSYNNEKRLISKARSRGKRADLLWTEPYASICDRAIKIFSLGKKTRHILLNTSKKDNIGNNKKIGGRKIGLNLAISLYILYYTGEVFDRKQISSHKEVNKKRGVEKKKRNIKNNKRYNNDTPYSDGKRSRIENSQPESNPFTFTLFQPSSLLNNDEYTPPAFVPPPKTNLSFFSHGSNNPNRVPSNLNNDEDASSSAMLLSVPKNEYTLFLPMSLSELEKEYPLFPELSENNKFEV